MNLVDFPARFWIVGALGLSLSFGAQPAAAQEPAPENVGMAEDEKPIDLKWVTEGSGELGTRAKLKIPEGYLFGGNATTVKFLSLLGNIPGGDELGVVGPESMDWFVVFEFSDIGYVKDDDKDALDADAMLKTFQNATKEQNRRRQAQGLDTVEILGWAIPPRYDEKTNVLEWATKLKFKNAEDEHVSVNYKTKVLGRKGVMEVVVVCGADELEMVLPKYTELMKGFSFTDGERYAEYKPGDKIAQYGLAALVVGGATAVAAKAGLFAVILAFFKKGAKLIVLAIAGIGATIARLFKGRSNDDVA